MKHHWRFQALIIVLLFASLSCRATTILWAMPTPQPSSTHQPTPKPSGTPTLLPTKTPTVTATQMPAGEFQFGEIVALDFLRTDWQQKGSALVHEHLTGCAAVAAGGSGFPEQLPETTISGFTWLTSNGRYLLKIGDKIVGEIDTEYGEKKTDCRKAVETLLKSVHAKYEYAQAGICANASKQRLKVGGAITVRTNSYLRTEPLWAEETRIRLVAPTEKLEIKITGGPICGIYNKGEYSYWQVELSNGEKGWMAEGDLNEYYLALKK